MIFQEVLPRLRQRVFDLEVLAFVCAGLESLEIVRNVGWYVVQYPQVNWYGLAVPPIFGVVTLIAFLFFESRRSRSLWFITLPILGVLLAFTLYELGIIIPTLYTGFGVLGGLLVYTQGTHSLQNELQHIENQLKGNSTPADTGQKLQLLLEESKDYLNHLNNISMALLAFFVGCGAILYTTPHLANMDDPLVRNVRAVELLMAASFYFGAILIYGVIPLRRIRDRTLRLLLHKYPELYRPRY